MADENDDAITAEKLFWFLTTAYILRAVGLLRPDKEEKIDLLTASSGTDWREEVRSHLDINDTYIRSLYAVGTEFKTKMQSVRFILRGLGCPSTEERLSEFHELRDLE